MPFSKIAILGASGSLGPHILAALLETLPCLRHHDPDSGGFQLTLTYPAGLRLISLPSYSDKDALKGVLQGHDILIFALPAAVALQLEPTNTDYNAETVAHVYKALLPVPGHFSHNQIDRTFISTDFLDTYISAVLPCRRSARGNQSLH